MNVYNLLDFAGTIISQFNAADQAEADRVAAPYGTAQLFSSGGIEVPIVTLPPDAIPIPYYPPDPWAGGGADGLLPPTNLAPSTVTAAAEDNTWLWLAAGVGLLLLLKRR